MTGEADYRTPISEAEQFYEALKLLNVETVLVRVPESPTASAAAPAITSPKCCILPAGFEQHKSKM